FEHVKGTVDGLHALAAGVVVVPLHRPAVLRQAHPCEGNGSRTGSRRAANGVLAERIALTASTAAPRPRIEASRTTAVCASGMGVPDRSSASAICMMQPGLAVTTSSAPVAEMLAAFRSPRSRAGSGLRML